MTKCIFLSVLFGVMVLPSVSFAEWVECNTCLGCTSALSDDNAQVRLSNNIYSNGEVTCIHITGDNTELDCQDYSIVSDFPTEDKRGIFLEDVYDVKVHNCNLVNWGQDTHSPYTDGGIFLLDSENCVIENNVIMGVGEYKSANGIILNGSDCKGNVVESNSIYDVSMIGIGINLEANDNDIERNFVAGAWVGVMPCFGGVNNRITENYLTRNTHAGICLCGGTTRDNTLTSNYSCHNMYLIGTDKDPGIDIRNTASFGLNTGDYNTCRNYTYIHPDSTEEYIWADNGLDEGCSIGCDSYSWLLPLLL